VRRVGRHGQLLHLHRRLRVQRRRVQRGHRAPDALARVLLHDDVREAAAAEHEADEVHHGLQWTGEECQAGDAGLPAACAPPPPTPAPTKEFPTCGVRISLGNGAGFHCEDDPSATEHAGKKIVFACCDADMRYSTCTRADADGECYAGFLNPVSNFAPKTWHEATNVCAAEGKVLCGVEQPCMNKGCHYNGHYQWTGEE
ncbi:unnamed protein product, partial [Pelagomonas calceolata]